MVFAMVDGGGCLVGGGRLIGSRSGDVLCRSDDGAC